MLLLTNGQVVSGKIRKQAANYVVRKDSGSRIIFSAEKVAMVCSDWNDLYWQKCALLRATDVAGHMRLFAWCIKHDLVDSAQNQIDLLQHMNVSPSKLHAFDKQLDETRLAIAQRLKIQAQELVRQADAVASGKKDYNVKTVGYEESLDQPSRFRSTKVAGEPSRAVNSVHAKQLSKAQKQASLQVDPFDPAEFNQKYVLRENVLKMQKKKPGEPGTQTERK